MGAGRGTHTAILGPEAPLCVRAAGLPDCAPEACFSVHLAENWPLFTQSQNKLYHWFTFFVADPVAFPHFYYLFDNESSSKMFGEKTILSGIISIVC